MITVLSREMAQKRAFCVDIDCGINNGLFVVLTDIANSRSRSGLMHMKVFHLLRLVVGEYPFIEMTAGFRRAVGELRHECCGTGLDNCESDA